MRAGGGGVRATLLKPAAKLRKGLHREPERGPGRRSYPLSRWERVGVRAGGGGGRATLLKPTTRVTQKSPAGEDWRQSPLRSTEGHGAASYSLSRWERVGVRAGGGGARATLLKPTTLTPTGPFRPLPLWEPLQNRVGSWRGSGGGIHSNLSPSGETERGRGEAGSRATLLKPAPRVTQKSPAGEDWRQSPLRSTEGHGGGLTPSPAGRGLG